jgi:hypothetical protein
VTSAGTGEFDHNTRFGTLILMRPFVDGALAGDVNGIIFGFFVQTEPS